MPITIPFDVESELGVIGCCLMGGADTAAEAIEKLPVSALSRDDLQAAFMIITDLVSKGKLVNLVTFDGEWRAQQKANTPQEIVESLDKVPSASNLPYYLEKLLDCARRRKLMYAAQGLLNKSSDISKTTDELIAEAEAILGGEDLQSVEILDANSCCSKLVDHLEFRHRLQGKRSGLVTGFQKFDFLTDGLQLGEQTVIAARPSMGKTAIGLNIIEQVCLRDQIPTLFVTLEMSTEKLMQRLLSSWQHIPLRDLRSGSFSEADFQKFTAFNAKIVNSPFYLIEAVKGIDINRLSASIRRVCRKFKIQLVVTDYLQKIHASKKHEKRTYEVAEVSTSLKGLAVETNAAFVTLAQLNREGDKDKGRMPRLSDLADSGQIERDADTVGLLHRDKANDSTDAKVIIAKQRDGETGVVSLIFNGPFCRFENPTDGAFRKSSSPPEKD